MATVCVLIGVVSPSIVNSVWQRDGDGRGLVVALIMTILAASTVLAAFWALRDLFTAQKRASELPHVPPVKPDALPAEEVLVRGAAQPCSPNETLLRAGVKSEETNAE
jgi:hypothetical protein